VHLGCERDARHAIDVGIAQTYSGAHADLNADMPGVVRGVLDRSGIAAVWCFGIEKLATSNQFLLPLAVMPANGCAAAL